MGIGIVPPATWIRSNSTIPSKTFLSPPAIWIRSNSTIPSKTFLSPPATWIRSNSTIPPVISYRCCISRPAMVRVCCLVIFDRTGSWWQADYTAPRATLANLLGLFLYDMSFVLSTKQGGHKHDLNRSLLWCSRGLDQQPTAFAVMLQPLRNQGSCGWTANTNGVIYHFPLSHRTTKQLPCVI